MLDFGADVNAKSISGITPLHAAIDRGSVIILKQLLISGADVHVTDRNGCGALDRAIQSQNYYEVVNLLLEFGASLGTMKSENMDSLLPTSVRSKNVKVIRLLVEAGVDVNQKDAGGSSPLHHSLVLFDDFGIYKNKYTFIVKMLLDAGARVNTRDNDGWTPLHYCAGARKLNALKILVDAGADPNECNNDGDVPLAIFIKSLNHVKDDDLMKSITKFLIERTDIRKIEKNSLVGALKTAPNASERSSFYEIFLQHVAKLRAMNVEIDPDLIAYILSSSNCNAYFTKCLEELEKAKSTKLRHCWVKFFNLLVDSED